MINTVEKSTYSSLIVNKQRAHRENIDNASQSVMLLILN